MKLIYIFYVILFFGLSCKSPNSSNANETSKPSLQKPRVVNYDQSLSPNHIKFKGKLLKVNNIPIAVCDNQVKKHTVLIDITEIMQSSSGIINIPALSKPLVFDMRLLEHIELEEQDIVEAIAFERLCENSPATYYTIIKLKKIPL